MGEQNYNTIEEAIMNVTDNSTIVVFIYATFKKVENNTTPVQPEKDLDKDNAKGVDTSDDAHLESIATLFIVSSLIPCIFGFAHVNKTKENN